VKHKKTDPVLKVLCTNQFDPDNVSEERLEPFIKMLYEGALAYYKNQNKEVAHGESDRM
jgi:hypothetical protein